MKLLKLLFVVLLAFATSAANADELDRIVKKHLKVSGADKQEKLKTIQMEMETSQMGMMMTMKMFMKNPNKFRMVMNTNGMDIVTVYNGEKGWIKNSMMGTVQELPENQVQAIKNQAVNKNQLSDYREKGAKLVGEKEFNGKKCYEVSLNIGDNTTNIFIDKQTYYMVGSVVKSQQGEVSSVVESFKMVEGIFFPIKMVTKTAMGDVALVFKNIKIDEPIEDSMFVKPE